MPVVWCEWDFLLLGVTWAWAKSFDLHISNALFFVIVTGIGYLLYIDVIYGMNIL